MTRTTSITGRLRRCLALGLLGLMVQAAPARTVVEFYNTSLDQYFITSDADEAAAIDRGAAGPGWIRTGDTFNEGGVVPVCRFYGSRSPGPNSHFYTASAAECAALRQLQAVTPATEKRWNFESLDFFAALPTAGACPAGYVPVYRAYNNGFARGVDSNHRITANRAGIQAVVSRGWIDEGVVMCGATAATVAQSAAYFASVRGVWMLPEIEDDPYVLRITADGGYMTATGRNRPDLGVRPGFEFGRMSYDPATGRFGVVPLRDTNGAGGLSDRGEDEKAWVLRVSDNRLQVIGAGGSLLGELPRADSVASSLVGVWTLADPAAGGPGGVNAQTFVFTADGIYGFIDPVGDVDPSSCGPPGVEFGTYAYSAASRTLTLTGIFVDTNGCAGLNEPPPTGGPFGGRREFPGIVLSPGGDTLTFEGVVVLRRVTP